MRKLFIALFVTLITLSMPAAASVGGGHGGKAGMIRQYAAAWEKVEVACFWFPGDSLCQAASLFKNDLDFRWRMIAKFDSSDTQFLEEKARQLCKTCRS